MTSRSSSRSDGEVVSSDSDVKAKKSLSSRIDNQVDRRARPQAKPRSPTNISRQSRSRSPYRASRGEKRRRDDEPISTRPRNDHRKIDPRYDDDRYSRHHQTEQDKRHLKRHRRYSRSQSRSPPRRHKAPIENSNNAIDKRHESPRHRIEMGRREGQILSKASVSQKNRDTTEAQFPEMNAKTSHDQNLHPLVATGARSNENEYDNHETNKSHVDKSNNTTGRAETDHDFGGGPIQDEASLIEERRRRREAIKNKYRGQATPLLVQALHLGSDPVKAFPDTDSVSSSPRRSASPLVSTPLEDQENSPQSENGNIFANDEDLANSDKGSPREDEPSAADYNPTVDMEEERARHDRKLFKEDEDSLKTADQKAINKTVSGNEQQTDPVRDGEFDMFAENNDDDDDMFAEHPVQGKSIESKTAQALDVGLMDNWDDTEGYYNTILGELIENRYHITANLGKGMFASVVRATDASKNQTVAIKIVRNNETMHKAGIKEIDILKDIATNDPEDKKHVIRLERSFEHKGHLCMVFENLSMNLREVLKKFGRDVGINIKAIRVYAQQLFLGLTLLKKCQYLHADLKPDNILVNDARNLLKICDLGSASLVTENATAPYLVSRFYRAPEVILGIPYDYGIDMWSVGCTLFELYTGKILFTGRNNNNMLRSIMECRGKFPHKLLRRGTLSYEYFDDLLNFRSTETDKVTGRSVTKLIDVKAKPVRDLRSRLIPKGKKVDEVERKEVELFTDLLDKCLDLRPDRRITPAEALKHPFIMRIKA